jgi:hypothetical protein
LSISAIPRFTAAVPVFGVVGDWELLWYALPEALSDTINLGVFVG